eukprot:1140266-Pelagomonas_calceolata.AAC.10
MHTISVKRDAWLTTAAADTDLGASCVVQCCWYCQLHSHAVIVSVMQFGWAPRPPQCLRACKPDTTVSIMPILGGPGDHPSFSRPGQSDSGYYQEREARGCTEKQCSEHTGGSPAAAAAAAGGRAAGGRAAGGMQRAKQESW